MVLAELDIATERSEAMQHFDPKSHGKRKKSFSKSRSDSGFSTTETSSLGLSYQTIRSGSKDNLPLWTCLSQYCTLITSSDTHVALEVTKSLRPWVHCGSRHLKEELFRLVILPSILRYERGSQESHTFPAFELPGGRSRSVTVPFPSGWTQRRSSTRQKSELTPREDESQRVGLPSESRPISGGISQEVLQLCINYLPSHLVDEKSHSLFLSCGGLNELQSLLCVEDVLEPVLEVLEFLAMVEDRQHRFQKPSSKNETEHPITRQEEKSDGELATKTFLSLLQYTVNLLGNSEQEGLELELSASAEEFVLGIQVWQVCLRLVSSSNLFRQLFVADGGPAYSYQLLRCLLEFFVSCSVTTSGLERNSVDSESERLQRDMAGLLESVLPVCIRLAHTRCWEEYEVWSLFAHNLSFCLSVSSKESQILASRLSMYSVLYSFNKL